SIGKYPVRQTVFATYGAPYTKECSADKVVEVNIGQYPQVNFNHRFVCHDDVTEFTSSPGPAFVTTPDNYIAGYTWYLDDGNILNGTGLAAPTYTFGTAKTYDVRLTMLT